METIKWAVNHMPKTEDANLPVMALSEVEKAPHVPRKFSAIQCHTTRKTEPHGRKIRTWFTLHQG